MSMAPTATGTFSTPVRGKQEFVESSESRANGVLRTAEAQAPLIFSAAAKSAEFSDRIRCHYRETRRMPVEIPCSVELVLMDGTVFDSGTAVVRDVSPSGALLASFVLVFGSFPASLFKIRMVLNGEPYAGIGIEATPVRFAMGTHGVGVKFDEIFVAV
jgi:hypothetical protein